MAKRQYDCSKLKSVIFNSNTTDNSSKEKEEFCQRLAYFVDNFQKSFLDKTNEYEEQVEGVETKINKTTKLIKTALVGGVSGIVACTTKGVNVNSLVRPVFDEGGAFFDTHRGKARKVTLKLGRIFNDLQQNELLRIAIAVFSTYEEQFTTTPFKSDKEWLINRKGLIDDAIKTIMVYLHETDEEKLIGKPFEEVVIESLINSKNDSYLPASINSVVKKGKSVAKKGYNDWTFKRLNEKSGFLVGNKYYWKGKETPKFGFKKLSKTKPFDNLVECKGKSTYKYKLNLINLDAIVQAIEKISENRVTGDCKDINSLVIKGNKKQQNKLQDISKDVIANKETSQNVLKVVEEIKVEVCKIKNSQEDSKQKEKRNEVKSEEILSPVASFIGRENELKAIHEKLNSDEESSQGRIAHAVCICGLGGMGKTELARKYVEIHRKEFKENVYWINADNITYDEQAIKDFYKKIININTSSKSKILIVLDNAHKFEDVVPFFPKTRMNNVFFLITSRSKDWDAQQEGEIRLVELTTFEEARELIENKLPEERVEDVDKLIEIVGSLPLALQQAISFITNKQKKQITLKGESNYKIQDYVKEFKKNSKTFLDKKFDRVRYLETVYTTWNITFQQIEQDEEHGEKAIKIMRIIAYLDPTFEVSFLTEDNGFDEDAVLLLNRYSLINLTSEWNNVIWASVHRLVQEVIRMQIREISTSIADCNQNLEETILSQLICFKDIFDKENEDFWERLQDKKYVDIFKNYCKNISQLEKISLLSILRKGKRLFETMWTEKYLNWREDNVKEAIRQNIESILEFCDVDIACEILNELKNENPPFELHNLTSYTESEKDEIKQQTFKLIALLRNREEESKVALLEHLSQIKDANLGEILKMSYVYGIQFKLFKTKYEIISKNLLILAIDKDHPGILSRYLLKHLKQVRSHHLEYAIARKKENAFCELANKEYIEEYKNIFINEKPWDGLNIFDCAYANGTLKMVKHLESIGFKKRSNDLTFYLPFYIKCEFEVFEYAFCNDVINARIKDSLGRSALFYATRARRVDLLEFLIRSSEKCFAIDLENEEDIKGNTLLHYAVSQCYMNKGEDDVDKNYIFSEGRGNTIYNTGVTKLVLETGVDISKGNVYGQTAFMVAAYWHDEEAIECLLPTTDSAAVSLIINQRCCDGRTALHYAAMRGNYKEIRNLIPMLLRSSTIPSFSFSRKSFIKTKNAIEILLKCGANVNKKDKFGCLPLHYACMHFKSLTDCELLGFKWNEWPSLKDRQGNTPLHCAAVARNTDLLYELRKIDEATGDSSNIVVNVVNCQKRNLLHSLAISAELFDNYCDYNDYKNVLHWLTNKKRLDLSAKDIDGHTPMDYARKRNNRKFIKAIERIYKLI